MGLNEALLLITSICSAGFVYLAWKFDKERLFSLIVIFLILISLVGGKVVTYFGFPTNAGNIFYSGVFLATYFLIERYGRREGRRSILIGIVGVLCFSLMLQMALMLIAATESEEYSAVLSAALGTSARIAFASLAAYTMSQIVNVNLYIYLKERMSGMHLWLRANVANAVAQILDCLVFFTLAFGGTTTSVNIVELALTGLIIKVVFMMCAAPLLYFNTMNTEEDEDGNAIHTLTIG